MHAYLFPGQGAQYPGMGYKLYSESKLAKAYFQKADEILEYSISEIMFDGAMKDLKQTKHAQLAIFLHSYILVKTLGTTFKPDMVAGHSLGEITALAAVGSLDFESAVRLISKRSAMMQKVCENENTGMAVVIGLYDVIVKDICEQTEGVVVPANFNTLQQVVISGEIPALKKVCKKLSPAAARIVNLPVSGAFHSPFMSSISEEFKVALDETEFKKPICPVYQNIKGRPCMDVELIKTNLLDQLTKPVMWRHAMLHMVEDGATEFTEIGPGNFLSGISLQINKNIKVNSIS